MWITVINEEKTEIIVNLSKAEVIMKGFMCNNINTINIFMEESSVAIQWIFSSEQERDNEYNNLIKKLIGEQS